MTKSGEEYVVTNTVQLQYYFNGNHELDWAKDANSRTYTITYRDVSGL